MSAAAATAGAKAGASSGRDLLLAIDQQTTVTRAFVYQADGTVLGQFYREKRTVVRMDAEIENSGGPWLLGPEISLADVSVMPVIVRLADLKQQKLWQDKPTIARWLDEIRGQPAYSKTYYHGTHLTELYPHLREKASA